MDLPTPTEGETPCPSCGGREEYCRTCAGTGIYPPTCDWCGELVIRALTGDWTHEEPLCNTHHVRIYKRQW
jgi:hypothetical protein